MNLTKKITVKEVFYDGTFILKIDGHLNRESVNEFYTILEPYYYRHKPIVLDLSTLSFLDNFCVVAFIERYQWSRVLKKEFQIKGLNKKIKKKLILAGLSDFHDLDKKL